MPIIEVQNIGKKYNIGQREGYLALRDVLMNFLRSPAKWLGAKIQRFGNPANEFWALKDVNFSIEKGEALGIIGRNGAGKSTLLKLLSQITPPTTGQITIRGSVGSLLEVGTGFHPELTGRENVFLNGVILGMKKKEIEAKFDQIAEFSGVEKFLDTPVKRYSSGMYVRLAFAVAAHLEPDVLLVDEVLSVGDIEFQKKCLRKMEEVTQKDGRTIIFVSHNIATVQALCTKCVLLDKGRMAKYGPTAEVVEYYLNQGISGTQSFSYQAEPQDNLLPDLMELQACRLTDEHENPVGQFGTMDDIYVVFDYRVKQPVDSLFVDFYVYNDENQPIFSTSDHDSDPSATGIRMPGRYAARCKIPKKLLKPGKYQITIVGHNPGQQHFFTATDALNFEVYANGGPASVGKARLGVISPELEWVTKKNN